MDASNSTPHGLKSLLESLSRAALLAQPDDIPRFLCAHVENMIKFSDDQQLKDIIEVIFRYQCQWGKCDVFNVKKECLMEVLLVETNLEAFFHRLRAPMLS